jgi:hypothetical protein
MKFKVGDELILTQDYPNMTVGKTYKCVGANYYDSQMEVINAAQTVEVINDKGSKNRIFESRFIRVPETPPVLAPVPTLKEPELKISKGVWLTADNYVIELDDNLRSVNSPCPGINDTGTDTVKWGGGWQWKFDGTIGGLTPEWIEKLRIVKKLDVNIPELPKGYKHARGFPTYRIPSKDEQFLFHDELYMVDCITPRFIIEPIDSPTETSAESAAPIEDKEQSQKQRWHQQELKIIGYVKETTASKEDTDKLEAKINYLERLTESLCITVGSLQETKVPNIQKELEEYEQVLNKLIEQLRTTYPATIEKKPKTSITRKILAYPLKWVFNKVSIALIAGTIGYTYFNGLPSLPYPKYSVTHSVVSFDSKTNTLVTREYGKEKRYAKTGNAWFDVDNGFQPISNDFLDRVGTCLEIGITGPEIAYPTEKNWSF